MSKMLASIRKNWDKAFEHKDEQVGGNQLEDGKYLGVLHKAELGEANSGRPQIYFEFRVTEGEHKGEHGRLWIGMDKPESIQIVMRTLKRLGIEVPEDIDELDDVLSALVKKRPLVRFSVKTKNEYTNLYVDKLMGQAIDESEAADEPEGESDAEGAETEAEGAEPEAEAEESVDLETGMYVSAKQGKVEYKGMVTKINEKTGDVVIKTEAGKLVKCTVDQLAVIAKPKGTKVSKK